MSLAKQIQDEFISEFRDAFLNANNNMSVGLGKNSVGETTLEVRLTNGKLKSVLPSNYHGLEVNVVVIGKVSALEG